MKKVVVNNKKSYKNKQKQQYDNMTPMMRSKSSLYNTPLPTVTITKKSIETLLEFKQQHS